MRFIIDIFFEPVFVICLLGVLAILYKGKHLPEKKMAMALVILTFFMLSWRLVVAQVSTRYWVAILFPGLLIVGYFLYLPQMGKRISRLLFFALLLACIGKDFHLNWNNSSIINASTAIKEDAQKYSNCLVSELYDTGLLTRIGYYSNVPINAGDFNIDNRLAKDNDVESYINMCYESSRGLYDVIYIVNESDEASHLDLFDKLNSIGAVVIFAQDKDTREKNKIYVYKISIPAVEKTLKSTETVILNGDFEDINKYTDKDSGLEWFYPAKWGNVKQWLPDTGIRLEQQSPISGKNSISFPEEKEIVFGAARIDAIKQDGLILFNVKSASGAIVKMSVIFCDRKGKTLSQRTLLNTIIPDNELHQVRVPWKKNDSDKVKYLRFYWYVKAPNGLVMDDVMFFPKEQAEIGTLSAI